MGLKFEGGEGSSWESEIGRFPLQKMGLIRFPAPIHDLKFFSHHLQQRAGVAEKSGGGRTIEMQKTLKIGRFPPKKKLILLGFVPFSMAEKYFVQQENRWIVEP